jgi:hypothetical protein
MRRLGSRANATKPMTELTELEGSRVSLALRDGSRLDDCQLVSTGRKPAGKGVAIQQRSGHVRARPPRRRPLGSPGAVTTGGRDPRGDRPAVLDRAAHLDDRFSSAPSREAHEGEPKAFGRLSLTHIRAYTPYQVRRTSKASRHRSLKMPEPSIQPVTPLAGAGPTPSVATRPYTKPSHLVRT